MLAKAQTVTESQEYDASFCIYILANNVNGIICKCTELDYYYEVQPSSHKTTAIDLF